MVIRKCEAKAQFSPRVYPTSPCIPELKHGVLRRGRIITPANVLALAAYTGRARALTAGESQKRSGKDEELRPNNGQLQENSNISAASHMENGANAFISARTCSASARWPGAKARTINPSSQSCAAR